MFDFHHGYRVFIHVHHVRMGMILVLYWGSGISQRPKWLMQYITMCCVYIIYSTVATTIYNRILPQFYIRCTYIIIYYIYIIIYIYIHIIYTISKKIQLYLQVIIWVVHDAWINFTTSETTPRRGSNSEEPSPGLISPPKIVWVFLGKPMGNGYVISS